MKRILSLIILSTVLIGCNSTNKDLGSGKNPIKFYLMPRMESTIMDESAEVLADFLENDTGFTVEVVVAKDYIDIVNFISEKKADVALLNTLGYILAHDWSGAEANLKVLYGDRQATYKGALLVQTNSNINSVRDLNGKKVAFTTPYSTSGYLLPTKTFHDKKIKPSKTIFAGSYAQAMDMLYNGQVDAAVSYYNSIGKNEYEDARNLINDKYPDANKKLRILTLTGEIPSGPIVFRRNLPENVKTQMIGALIKFSRSPAGKKILYDTYSITGLELAYDSDYAAVREILQTLGKSVEEVVPGGLTFYSKNVLGIEREM